MPKKFIVYSLPRSGTEHIFHTLRHKTDIKVPLQHEPFEVYNSHAENFNHIDIAKKVFNEYDCFKVVDRQTLQLETILKECNADLILVRRIDYFSVISSICGLVKGIPTDSTQASTWTSTGGHMVYDKSMMNFFLDQIIYKVMYCNHLIDNVYTKLPQYAGTLVYEQPKKSSEMLSEYLGCDVQLNFHHNKKLSDYWTNPDDFKNDVVTYLKKITK